MDVLEWLLDSDPAIRWQVTRHLGDQPAEVVASERARVASEGWGARLLALQGADGQWGGGAYHPYWTSTTYTLLLLRHLGLDPSSDQARRAVGLVRDNVELQWTEEDSRPFFSGEIETCINGMVLALGAYFGEVDTGLVDRLLGEQLPDGGWNCWAGEAWPDDETDRSSFHTTITVLEGLLEYEQAEGPDPTVTAARRRGEEYLLARRLFRKLSTGQLVKPEWIRFSFPPRWHYDVLRGLEYLAATGDAPDPRCQDAVELVTETRGADGRWLLENPHPGDLHFEMEQAGEPSRWNTLRALRVLRWYQRGG